MHDNSKLMQQKHESANRIEKQHVEQRVKTMSKTLKNATCKNKSAKHTMQHKKKRQQKNSQEHKKHKAKQNNAR